MSDTYSPSLSIVIPAHNAADTLAEQLAAVSAAMDDTMELIVVDNLSTDGTFSLVQSWSERDSRIRVVQASNRQGEPHARNVGIAAARSDLIAMCDADDVVGGQWAVAMRDALGQSAMATGPVQLDLLNPIWLRGVRGRRIFDEIPRTLDDVPFAHGCNIGIRRSVAESIGGFDETALIGCDVLFAVKAHAAGFTLAWSEEAVIHYRFRQSTIDRWQQAKGYGRATRRLQQSIELAHTRATQRRRNARRCLWLIKMSPRLYDRALRARWTWTLALVVGETFGGKP